MANSNGPEPITNDNQDCKAETMVVVSHFVPRGTEDLRQLLTQAILTPSGEDYRLLIACNLEESTPLARDSSAKLIEKMICDVKEGTRNHTNLSLPLSIDLGFRTNTGMNIGAWDWAWRATKKASRFLFLQDEVEILRPGWLSAFTLAHLAHRNENGERPLLLGESWNHRWDQPWDTLSQSELNSPNKSQHYQGTIASKGNVDFVRNLLADWSIEEGVTGGHLRSLIWYTDLKSLEKINGFHVGQTRGECIAAEIAASKAIATSGGIVRQLRETPFTQLWHREWRKDGISKLSASPAKQVSTRTS